jgi:hypothetical protein
VCEWDSNAAKISIFPAFEQSFETFGNLALALVVNHAVYIAGRFYRSIVPKYSTGFV